MVSDAHTLRLRALMRTYPSIGEHYHHNVTVRAVVDAGIVGGYPDARLLDALVDALVQDGAAVRAELRRMLEGPVTVAIAGANLVLGYRSAAVQRFAAYLREHLTWGLLHVVFDEREWATPNVLELARGCDMPEDVEGLELARMVDALGPSERERLCLDAEAHARERGWL
jgi:hypothetical protein